MRLRRLLGGLPRPRFSQKVLIISTSVGVLALLPGNVLLGLGTVALAFYAWMGLITTGFAKKLRKEQVNQSIALSPLLYSLPNVVLSFACTAAALEGGHCKCSRAVSAATPCSALAYVFVMTIGLCIAADVMVLFLVTKDPTSSDGFDTATLGWHDVFEAAFSENDLMVQ